jgi:hypothetical protein
MAIYGVTIKLSIAVPYALKWQKELRKEVSITTGSVQPFMNTNYAYVI